MNFITLLIFAGVLVTALITAVLAFPVFLFVTQLPVPSASLFCNIAVAINIALMIAVNIYLINGGAGLLKIATMIISIIYVATLAVGTFVGIKFHAMQWHLSLATYADFSLPFFLLIELLIIITATWIKSSASKFWENGGFNISTNENSVNQVSTKEDDCYSPSISETCDILQLL